MPEDRTRTRAHILSRSCPKAELYTYIRARTTRGIQIAATICARKSSSRIKHAPSLSVVFNGLTGPTDIKSRCCQQRKPAPSRRPTTIQCCRPPIAVSHATQSVFVRPAARSSVRAVEIPFTLREYPKPPVPIVPRGRKHLVFRTNNTEFRIHVFFTCTCVSRRFLARTPTDATVKTKH